MGLLKWFRARHYRHTWELGSCGNSNRPARRHRKNGNVQFLLWPAGEQGHRVDYWHDFDSSWWNTFESELED